MTPHMENIKQAVESSNKNFPSGGDIDSVPTGGCWDGVGAYERLQQESDSIAQRWAMWQNALDVPHGMW